ncbi:MAG: GIY-YIG nuclease family protein [Candidatus Acidiferrales bacterium]|jgi:putative endonuclease
MSRTYYVYILASRSRNLYTGVTNSLGRRLVEHREGRVPGFTTRYKIFRLVHYEVFRDVRAAIAREKEIKAWRRERKLWLIKRHNPTWEDLAARWSGNEQEQRAKRVAPENANDRAKADPSPPSKNRPGSG